MESIYETLKDRGFIEQVTDEEKIASILGSKQIACYIGFDPTATSLHIGSLVPILALMHLQRAGHRTIALVGGGTALIGDPSGKTEMRKLLTIEEIRKNEDGIKKQLSRYLDFSPAGGAVMVNNADWLTTVKYIDFLRDIGKHFSVNKMLTADSYRTRMEKGLNFIEFNYMLLQAYDFLHLFSHQECVLQLGGNDQWGNILAGADLIRRVKGAEVFGITFPLLTTASGHKMGKTERGTVWLDGNNTLPYEYYQYWVNIDDADIKKFLLLFTFLPIDEINGLALKDSELNMAKAILAFEVTKITHGEASALEAWQTSAGAFGATAIPAELLPSSSIPRFSPVRDFSAMFAVEKSLSELAQGIPAYKLFVEAKLCSSYGEARRLIAQGGAYINDIAIVNPDDEVINNTHLNDRGEIIIRKGKKTYALIKGV